MTTPSRRFEMQGNLLSGPPCQLDGARRPLAGDKRALAELMFAAYQGTVDYSGESVEDAEIEMEKTFTGGYGTFSPECSYVVERASELVCASLITFHRQVPLLAFAMTAPAWKRNGLARAAVLGSMHDLRARGATQLHLAVNPRNQFAIDLYESLGFEAKP